MSRCCSVPAVALRAYHVERRIAGPHLRPRWRAAGVPGRAHSPPSTLAMVWLAPPQLARLVRGVGAAHQSGVLYGGAAAACAVAAGSLYYADHVERSQNNSLAEELNASEQRRRRRFHTVVRGLPEQAKPTLRVAGMGRQLSPDPTTPSLLGRPRPRARPAPPGRCRPGRILRRPYPARRPDPAPNPSQVVPGA